MKKGIGRKTKLNLKTSLILLLLVAVPAVLLSQSARSSITGSSLYIFAKMYFSKSDGNADRQPAEEAVKPPDQSSSDRGSTVPGTATVVACRPGENDEKVVDSVQVREQANGTILPLVKQPPSSSGDGRPEEALRDFVSALKVGGMDTASSVWPDFQREFLCDAGEALSIRKAGIFPNAEDAVRGYRGYIEISCKLGTKAAVLGSCFDMVSQWSGWTMKSTFCTAEGQAMSGNGEGALRTVKDFYGAVKAGDCARAAALRPGYTEAQCLDTTEVQLRDVRLMYLDNNRAVVHIDLTFKRGGKSDQFSGYLVVDRAVGGWRVNGSSYRGVNVAEGLERYLVNVIGRGLGVEDITPADAAPKRTDAVEAAPIVDGLTFGSNAVLQSCWTPSELKGDLVEKRIAQSQISQKNGPSPSRPQHWVPPLFPAEQNSIRSVTIHNDKPYIALTFDLCERSNEIAGYDAEIVDYLRANKIRATFFAGGKWMATHRERAMQLMADPLFEVGNHSWSHANLRVMDHHGMENQILWTQAQYESLWRELSGRSRADPGEMMKIPAAPMVFRFPFGTCNAESLRLLAKYGITAIQWSIVTGDPAKGQTAEGISQTVLKQARPGSIIICHANGRGHGTAAALPVIVRELKKRGFTFVTVSELLRLGRINATEDCFELKPNDNLHYDRIFNGEG